MLAHSTRFRAWTRGLLVGIAGLCTADCRCALFDRWVPEYYAVRTVQVTPEVAHSVAQTQGANAEVRRTVCDSVCTITTQRCVVLPDRETPTVRCEGLYGGYCSGGGGCMFGCGRAPDGLTAPPFRTDHGLAQYLQELWWLEAASVPAFHAFAEELVAHGAPPRFVQRARLAARDEARHARLARNLARAHGLGLPRKVHVRPRVRNWEAFARDNALEGCIRESFAAVLASYQAHAAQDPAFRTLFTALSHDEHRHAALAWSVHHWVLARSTESLRATLQSEQTKALDALAASPSLSDRTWAPSVGMASQQTWNYLLASFRAQVQREYQDSRVTPA